MYQRAVQTETNWAFAYEVPMGGYALRVAYIGHAPILDDEAEFCSIETLEIQMKEIAPLNLWTESLFKKLTQ